MKKMVGGFVVLFAFSICGFMILNVIRSEIAYSQQEPNNIGPTLVNSTLVSIETIDGTISFRSENLDPNELVPVQISDFNITVSTKYVITDDSIKLLASSGRICKLFGHFWRSGRPGEYFDVERGIGFSFSDYHPYTNYRTCKICGKVETQNLEWK